MKDKHKFIYCVFCNREPLLYGLYESKQKAVRYAVDLVRYRRDRAKLNGTKFGYYHFHPLCQRAVLKWMKDETSPYFRDQTIFSACLRTDDKDKTWSDDRCLIKVDRRIISQ